MSKLLIKNGTIVTATDHYRADVLVTDEKVSAIAASLDESADRVIDAGGCYPLHGNLCQ
jgi:dihydropyrimidinase